MAPKKSQKMSLGDFLNDDGLGGGSWADEVEETYVAGTQPLPSSDRSRPMGGSSSWADRGYSTREQPTPQVLPDKPPYTAHLGNLSYDATQESVNEFFQDCDVANVRIIEDRELQRPKGFGYVEFNNVEGLKKALTLDGESFQGRMIKIKIADPPRGGDSGRGDFIRDMGDWTRKGPLEPPASARGGPGPRGASDFGERRAPRDPAIDARPPRDLNWGERRGPLAPLSPEEGGQEARSSRQRPAPEGMGERSESYRGGERRQSPATWGEGRADGSRPARREFTERPERPAAPERAPTAAEKDNAWRDRMRPEQAQSPPAGSAPGSPAPANATPAAPVGRPRLNLAKRTVSEAPDAASPSTTADTKANPFGGARPIDTATREKEIEEKRVQALQEKQEAEEKAKEERRAAKEAAEKEAEAQAAAKSEEAAATPPAAPAAEKAEGDDASAKQENGEQRLPVRNREPREPRDPASQPRGGKAFENNSWRSSGERGGRGGPRGGGRGGAPRGGRNDRGPRSNGSNNQSSVPATPTESEAPAQEDDGWTTVATGKKGRQGRP